MSNENASQTAPKDPVAEPDVPNTPHPTEPEGAPDPPQQPDPYPVNDPPVDPGIEPVSDPEPSAPFPEPIPGGPPNVIF